MDKNQKQDAIGATRGEHAHPAMVRREKAALIRQRIQTAYTRAEIPREVCGILLDIVALAELP